MLLLLAATITVVLATVFTGATPASAHAVVIGSTPTDGQTLASAPQEVQITFSEGVSSELGGLTVLNSAGDRVDNDDSKVGATGNVLERDRAVEPARRHLRDELPRRLGRRPPDRRRNRLRRR